MRLGADRIGAGGVPLSWRRPRPSAWAWLGLRRLGVACLLAVLAAGCSLKRLAISRLGDALAASGDTFASDDDPDLVRDAAPFSLKLMESLLAESPRHVGLRLASASGFTQYGYAFVQQQADELESKDVAAAAALRLRAQRLYVRARDHGLRGLEVRHPGFERALQADARKAAAQLRAADLPLAYWTATAWAAAISVVRNNADLIADLPIVEALVDRARALQPDYDHGALHTFLITFEMSRRGATGDPVARARAHYARALELSGGLQAAPFVALAEAVCIPQQDRAQFEALLQRAVALNPDARPAWRLANLVLQRRARWLLQRVDDLILPPLPVEEKK